MVLLGPEAQQLATYIGWLMHRTRGGIVADIFFGLKPAVTALVLHAAWRMSSRALKNRWLWGIALAAFVAIFAAKVPFPLIVAAAQKHFGAAPIDDDTPTPAHARFPRGRLARVAGIGLALWDLAMAVLIAAQGPGTGRDDTRAADHGGGLLHLRAAVRLHPRRWPVGRGDPRPVEVHGAAHRDHRSCRWRDSELALFFAYHVLWPQRFSERFEAVSAGDATLASLALFRFKVGVIALLAVCAAARLAATLLVR